eukprot:354857-Chlamydomonas_euryale.AAC.31
MNPANGQGMNVLYLFADVEKRWTLFSTLWFAVMEFKYFFFPPALRFLWFLATRAFMQHVYTAHKAFVLWRKYGTWKTGACTGRHAVDRTRYPVYFSPENVRQISAKHAPMNELLSECKLDAHLASNSCPSNSGQSGAFSRAMALRRLHWKNSLLGEMLYLVNIHKSLSPRLPSAAVASCHVPKRVPLSHMLLLRATDWTHQYVASSETATAASDHVLAVLINECCKNCCPIQHGLHGVGHPQAPYFESQSSSCDTIGHVMVTRLIHTAFVCMAAQLNTLRTATCCLMNWDQASSKAEGFVKALSGQHPRMVGSMCPVKARDRGRIFPLKQWVRFAAARINE